MLSEFAVTIFFPEKIARDVETSIKYQEVLKSTAWPRRRLSRAFVERADRQQI